MKTKLAVAVAAVAVMLTGCWQKAVYPFYKDKDVFFEEKLIGNWREPDKSQDEATTWTFAKSESPHAYNLHIADKETKVDGDARLFKLNGATFMDLYSRNRGIVDMPAHTLFRVNELGETFKLQMLSPGWIKNRLQLHPKEIANIFTPDPEHPDDADKGEFILAAPTDELQKYLLAHQNDEGFWESPGELKKLK